MPENQRFLLEQAQVSLCYMGLDLSCSHFKSLQYQDWSRIPFAPSLPLASGFLLLSAFVLAPPVIFERGQEPHSPAK